MKVTNHIKMVMVDIDQNNNKFWEMWEYEDTSTKTRWGRVSETDKAQEKCYPPGAKNFEKTWKEKERKGYRRVETIGSPDGPDVKIATLSGGGLKDLAVKQVAQGDKIIEALVSYLVRKNKHTITQNTSIKYDEATGLFRTPIGIVTQQNIDDARGLLSKIAQFVVKQQSLKEDLRFEDDGFKKLLEDYMRLIPTDVGRARGWHKTFLPDMNAVSGQNSILDALQASLDTVISGSDKDKKKDAKEEKVFDVRLKLNEDPKEFDRIKRLYGDTRQHGVHSCAHLEVKKVYDVRISSMEDGFERVGMAMKNIWELWHGTQAGNLLSILSKGMIIPPATASHCTGRAFGDGLYFSDQSTKSLNYAYGYWKGSTDNNCFMFLSDVAMGRYYEPRNTFGGRCPSGYDSTFAKAGSVFRNNEMIVYSTKQVRIKRLVEFAP